MTEIDARPQIGRWDVWIRLGMFGASVAWFGGLSRILAEAAMRYLPALDVSESDATVLRVAVVGTTALAAVEGVALWRWSWYRATIRQVQQDVRSLYGLPPRTETPTGVGRPILASTAIIVLPALLVAVVLPGTIAAAVAVMIGLFTRVGVAVVVSTSGMRAR
jgi:hypothetical protein